MGPRVENFAPPPLGLDPRTVNPDSAVPGHDAPNLSALNSFAILVSLQLPRLRLFYILQKFLSSETSFKKLNSMSHNLNLASDRRETTTKFG